MMLVWLLLPLNWAGAQLPVLPETLCVRYRFTPGDTLVYRIEAHDSILIGQEVPLRRERYETLWVLCDSVGSDGAYWLRRIASDFLARERMDTLQSLRPESPCTHRSVVLQLDSLGHRLGGEPLPEAPVVCSGGPFQLPLLVPLSRHCPRIHESWLVQDTVELWENGTPAPRLIRTALLRMFPRLDTLGYRCTAIEYVTTGTGWFARDSTLSARAVVNSFGRLLLADEGIPIWGLFSQEIRLTLSLGGAVQPGLHYLNVRYWLQERRTGHLRRSSLPSPSAPQFQPKPRR